MKARMKRLALVVAACALGALPAACATGTSSLPNTSASSTRTISSGGSANTGGGGGGGATVPPPSTGGGGGGAKAPLPGAMAFTSGCGAIDSVSSTAATNVGVPATVTITTKVAEHNCINVYFKVDFVNASTGQLEDTEACFNFTTTPYTCNIKDKTAQPGTTYQTNVTVWDASKSPLGAPVDPAAVLATESLTVTTAGAPPNQGA